MVYKKWMLGFVILVMAISLIGAAWAKREKLNPDNFRSAQMLPVPQLLLPFQLEGSSHNPFNTQNFSGHWSLLFFGFTECVDICPTELQHLSALKKLAEQHKLSSLQIVFISLDSERDTPEKMASYLVHFNPQIVGARGTHAELEQLSHFFAVDYSRVQAAATTAENLSLSVNGAGDYQLTHTGRVFIINPQMQYIGSFAPPHNVENMWADLQMIIK